MTIGGPRTHEGLLPLGGGRVMGIDHSAGRNFIQERHPEEFINAIWFFDLEEDLPQGLLEDEESEDEDILPPPPPPPSSDDEDDDQDDEESDGDWDSEGSISEDGLDAEGEDEDARPRSPLLQQLPPGRLQPGWSEEDPPPPPPTVRPLQELPVPPPEESAPSTSGLVSTAKRSREDSDPEQVSTKRQRWTCEESHEESAPSTSGLGPSTTRSDEESYMDSAPSTSGLGPSTFWEHWMRLFQYQDDDSDSD